GSKGTKVFALAGAIRNTGLVEVPIGMPLGDIIYDLGGGVPNGKRFKAAQLGGPSGGCIPRAHLDVPVDFDELIKVGAIMGSGGLIVMDEDTCMVDMARFFLDFVQDESCGKCPPCRIGSKRMLEIVTRICEGKGVEGDIERLEELGKQIRETSLCGLGQTAPNPVLSTIRHFRSEYEAHIREKRCPAGVCAGLVRAPCQSACPANVDVPGFVALVGQKKIAEALRLHERNLRRDVLQGLLGLKPAELPQFHIGEFGVGRGGLRHPNLWEGTVSGAEAEALAHEIALGHRGLLAYLREDGGRTARSATLWLTGRYYDLFGWMNPADALPEAAAAVAAGLGGKP
ncbi:MAG TPA: hypothetical protein DD417_07395, partial [Elusimicrobia bacterium]|nr:hypothetical protein [Elusimicrobiota bacterium]